MGFLDQSTNNIILDAVLTDSGRKFLSRNDGSFNIAKFAFGDDEVDYSIIEKYGRTVGKEKIEKNTPIFEAITNENYALKYKIISLSTPNLTRLPYISITSQNTTTVSLNTTDTRSASITAAQQIGGNETINVELVDQVYSVTINNLFLQLPAAYKPVSISADNIATYLIRRDSATNTSTGGSSITLKPTVKSSVTSTVFQTYGTQTDKTKIVTTASVRGMQSSSVLDFTIEITKTTTT